MTVKEIIQKYLADNGFDGLFNDLGECACCVIYLMPCQDDCSDCSPGYKEPCDCGERHNFHISHDKPNPNDGR